MNLTTYNISAKYVPKVHFQKTLALILTPLMQIHPYGHYPTKKDITGYMIVYYIVMMLYEIEYYKKCRKKEIQP